MVKMRALYATPNFVFSATRLNEIGCISSNTLLNRDNMKNNDKHLIFSFENTTN